MKAIFKKNRSDVLSGFTFYLFAFAAIFFMFVLLWGCKKEWQVRTSSNPPVQVDSAARNTAPFVSSDRLVFATVNDSVVLHGHANDQENNIVSYSWKKISGPASYKIAMPDFSTTTVTALELGEYQFELTVTDYYGLKAKAVVKVDVLQPGAHETTFTGLQWECPWGCSVFISNFHSFVAQGKPYQVYVQESDSAVWLQAKPENQWDPSDEYVFGEDGNTMWVYTDAPKGLIIVKVTY